MRKRLVWVDNARAIGMLLVFLGHILDIYIVNGHAGTNVKLPFSLIYSFHIPLFFFLSGVVFKERTGILHKDIYRTFVNLYIPFLFFELLVFFYHVRVALHQFGSFYLALEYFNRFKPRVMDLAIGHPVFSATSWFFSCLFMVQVIHLTAVKFIKSRRSLFISAVLFSLVGYWVAMVKSGNFSIYVFGRLQGAYYIESALIAICFFQMGNLLGKLEKGISLNRLYMLIAAVPLWLVSSILNLKRLPLLYGKVHASLISGIAMGNYLLYFSSAFLGIAIVLIISSVIPENRVLGFIGRKSMYFLGFNGLVYFMSRYIYFQGISNSKAVLLIALMLAVVNLLVFAPFVSVLDYIWSRGRSRLLSYVDRGP